MEVKIENFFVGFLGFSYFVRFWPDAFVFLNSIRTWSFCDVNNA